MMTKRISRHFLLKFSAIAFCCAGIFFWINFNKKTELPALTLHAPGKKFANSIELKPENIQNLLAESNYTPTSSQNSPVKEPELPPGHVEPPEAEALGFGKSYFVVDSPWATIRFIGENPAGVGLSGAELSKAQMQALGSEKDTIPVITAAQTINDMMNEYFAPLLRGLPRGEDILSRVKVQGAYYSPRHLNPDGTLPERDNAFIFGVQSLLLYPSSCFDKTTSNTCQPISYSAGHDPTIIGHELGHVIFNHLRDERSLEGWQWFAVNEGYADYFSAAYFGDPKLGRIWRVTRPSGARYLRHLLDTPSTNDPRVLEEGHAFGLVWSSTLWRIRSKLMTSQEPGPNEFDRIVLMSINFLGESTKTKLGDAASAVLKAADVSGYSSWKSTLISEFEKAEVDLTRGQKLAAASGQTLEKQQSGLSCGVIAKNKQSNSSGGFLALSFLPVFFMLTQLKRYKKFLLRLISAINLILLTGCQLANLWRSSTPSPQGVAIIYDCNLGALRDGTPSTPSQRKLSLTFPKSTLVEERTEQIFVGDERFENADSSLLMLVDKETMRIDQIRKRDGRLFQLNLNQKYVNSEDAIAVQNMRLGTIIFEGVGRAMLNQKSKQPSSNNSVAPSAISFELTGLNAKATLNGNITGARNFGPLPSQISIDGVTLCNFVGKTE